MRRARYNTSLLADLLAPTQPQRLRGLLERVPACAPALLLLGAWTRRHGGPGAAAACGPDTLFWPTLLAHLVARDKIVCPRPAQACSIA